jgi:hypothetical protein
MAEILFSCTRLAHLTPAILSPIARLPVRLYYIILFIKKMHTFRRLVLEFFILKAENHQNYIKFSENHQNTSSHTGSYVTDK